MRYMKAAGRKIAFILAFAMTLSFASNNVKLYADNAAETGNVEDVEELPDEDKGLEEIVPPEINDTEEEKPENDTGENNAENSTEEEQLEDEVAPEPLDTPLPVLITGNTNQEKAESIVSQMTPAEKLGQTLSLAPRYWGGNKVLTSEYAQFISDYHLGGECLFYDNLDENADDPIAKMVQLTDDMQHAAVDNSRFHIPMFMSMDQEGGYVNRLGKVATIMPGNMALGAIGDPESTRRAAQVLGEEMAALGFNVNFGPTLDVNTNPDNPIIGVRSFSSSPALTSELGIAYIEGMHDAGVLATAKHFPGHGDTATDSHSGLPLIPGEKEEVMDKDIFPFKTAIDSELDMVMTGHLVVEALDDGMVYSPSKDDYVKIPATFSKKILTDLLREELGFEGLIVTDSMGMAGASAFFPPVYAVELALLAGVDMPLMPPVQPGNQEEIDTKFKPFFNELLAKITPPDHEDYDPDQYSEELANRVDESVVRILTFKMDKGLYDPDAGVNQPCFEKTLDEKIAAAKEIIRSDEHLAIEKELSDKTITLAKNEIIGGKPVLPFTLEAGDTVFVLTSVNKISTIPIGQEVPLTEGVKKVIKNAGLEGEVTVKSSTYANGFTEQHKKDIDEATYVLIGSAVTTGDGRKPSGAGTYSLLARNVNDAWKYVQSKGYGSKTAGISLALPYELSFLEYCSAMVNTNSRMPTVGSPSMPVYESAVSAIFGEFNPTGKFPVDVPDPNPEAAAPIRQVGDSLRYLLADCDVTEVITPRNASINGTDITASVSGDTASQVINVKVSEGAEWKLYKDQECTAEITDKTMHYNSGENTAYIKVTAENGAEKCYTITVTKELLSACDIISVITPSGATINGTTITANVSNGITSQIINVKVSEGADWKLYNDQECTNEAADKNMQYNVGANTAYIKVTAEDGTDKTYTLTVKRASSESSGESSTSGGNSGPIIRDSAAKPNTAPVSETSKIIYDAIDKGKAPVIIISEKSSNISLSGKDLLANADTGRDLEIKKDNMNIAITPQIVNSLGLTKDSAIEITAIKQKMNMDAKTMEALEQMDSINGEMAKTVYTITLKRDGKEISAVNQLLKISVDVSDIKLTASQKNGLTAIYYDEVSGNYRQLGGEFSRDGKSFMFYSPNSGNHSLIVSDNLVKMELKAGNASYVVNDVSKINDVAPMVKEGRMIVPLRLIAEALNADVAWNSTTKAVTVTSDGKISNFVIGQTLPDSIGTAEIIGNRTFVPMDYISQKLGANIVWDNETQILKIYK